MAPISTSGLLSARQSGGDGSMCPSHLEVLKNVLAFFALNIGTHALTFLKWPGQRLPESIVIAYLMLLSPVFARVGYSHSFGRTIHLWRKRSNDPQKCKLPWRERVWRAILGQGEWPLQTAIDASAVAIEVDDRYRSDMEKWTRLNRSKQNSAFGLDALRRRDALWSSGEVVGDDDRAELVYVPVGTVTRSPMNVKPSSSWLGTLMAIVQLSYGTIELYASERPEVRERGLSSPYIVIIPYIVMSLMNLIINLVVTSYPYVTVLRPRGYIGPDEKDDRSLRAPRLEFHSESLKEKPLSDSGSLPNDATQPFEEWLKQTYLLTHLPTSEEITHQSWDYIMTLPITMFVSYGVITLVLLGVTRMQVESPLLAAGLLCWIYSGLVQLVVLFCTGIVRGVVQACWHVPAEAVWLNRATTGFFLIVVLLGSVVPGVYCTVIQLWKYYSLCG